MRPRGSVYEGPWGLKRDSLVCNPSHAAVPGCEEPLRSLCEPTE